MITGRLSRYGTRAFLFLALLLFILPVAWIVASAFKPPAQVASNPPTYLFTPTLTNFVDTFSQSGFDAAVINSLLAVGAAVIFALLVGTPAAYVLTRQRFRGRTNLLFWLLSLQMLPAIAIVVPLYESFLKLHLLGTLIPAIVTFTLFDMPFHVWMMRGFLNEVPRSIEEAARIDGCSALRTFLLVTVPLSRVGILTSVLFMVVFNWGSYLIPTVLSRGNQQLLPAVVGSAVGAQTINWGQLVAGAVVMTLPLLIIGFFVQRYVVRGLTFGAVK